MPANAVGIVEEVNTSRPAVTVRVSWVVAVFGGLLPSVTVMVSRDINAPPAVLGTKVVGVPLRTPWLLKVIPAGSDPLSVHVKLPTPPRSRRICVYGCPVDAPDSEVVVIAIGASGAVL